LNKSALSTAAGKATAEGSRQIDNER